jgi:hypothetical protein
VLMYEYVFSPEHISVKNVFHRLFVLLPHRFTFGPYSLHPFLIRLLFFTILVRRSGAKLLRSPEMKILRLLLSNQNYCALRSLSRNGAAFAAHILFLSDNTINNGYRLRRVCLFLPVSRTDGVIKTETSPKPKKIIIYSHDVHVEENANFKQIVSDGPCPFQSTRFLSITA